jgi:hypothetical protein
MDTINTSRHPDLLTHRTKGLQSQARAEYLRNVWRAAFGNVIKPIGKTGHWKDEVYATVPASKAAVMTEVMDFMGCIVNSVTDANMGSDAVTGYRVTCGGERFYHGLRSDEVVIYSKGYWAHDPM